MREWSIWIVSISIDALFIYLFLPLKRSRSNEKAWTVVQSIVQLRLWSPTTIPHKGNQRSCRNTWFQVWGRKCLRQLYRKQGSYLRIMGSFQKDTKANLKGSSLAIDGTVQISKAIKGFIWINSVNPYINPVSYLPTIDGATETQKEVKSHLAPFSLLGSGGPELKPRPPTPECALNFHFYLPVNSYFIIRKRKCCF